jgi:hypothetical protein
MPASLAKRHIRWIGWIALFTALSWTGEYVHNRVELPQLTVLSPENSIPALISLVLFIAWWALPFMRVTAFALFGWAAVQLVGGVISVLPLGLLPYYPAQTAQHYLLHVVYVAAQVPLIVALLRYRISMTIGCQHDVYACMTNSLLAYSFDNCECLI